MNDQPSKRDLQRELEPLGSHDETAPLAAFETDDGHYVDRDGKRITNWSSVISTVPIELRRMWEDQDSDLMNNVPKE